MNRNSIELIFLTFARRFGQRWKISHEDKPARKLWWRDLAEEGITDDEVQIGLRSCKTSEWPPSIGEFIRHCKTVKKPNYFKSLPPPERNRENEINHFKQMRIKLGMTTE